MTKLVFLYDQSQALDYTSDDENAAATSAAKRAAALDLEDKKISYFVEGIEGDVWKEYMKGARKQVVNKKTTVKGAKGGLASLMARNTMARNYNRMRT